LDPKYRFLLVIVLGVIGVFLLVLGFLLFIYVSHIAISLFYLGIILAAIAFALGVHWGFIVEDFTKM
jgi:hypothetical protein